MTGYTQAADGSISEVQAEADLDFQAGSGKKPPKGVLNWVAQPAPGQDPERAEVRALKCTFLPLLCASQQLVCWFGALFCCQLARYDKLAVQRSQKGVLNWVAQPAPGQDPERWLTLAEMSTLKCDHLFCYVGRQELVC